MALSKTRQSPSMVLDGVIHGANGFGEGHPPPLDSFRAARTGGRNQRQKHKQKRQPMAAFFACWGQIPLRRKGL